MENQAKIRWSVPEFEYKKRRADWYVAFAIASASAAAASFLLGNILFGMFIIIAALTLAIHTFRRPGILNVEIRDDGILVNNDFYKYKSLKSFWVDDEDAESKIVIHSESMLLPYVTIPLGEVSGEQVRNFLSLHIEEVEHKEPISQKIMEYLGF